MANYTKTVDFATKDSLLTGNPLKLVKGTEIDTEFNNISTAITSKANSASPTFTGTLTGAIANYSGLLTASLGLTVSGAAFTSRGITDNATATVLYLDAGASEYARIGATGTVTLGGTSTAPALKVIPGGSNVSWVNITGAAVNPYIGANSGLLLFGNVVGAPNFAVESTASAVNYIKAVGGTAGNPAQLFAAGSTDVSMRLNSAGIGGIHLLRSAGGAFIAKFDPVSATADRYFTFTSGETASGNPKITASAGSIDIGSSVVLTSQTVGSTVGAAGGASALPATPLGYLTTSINGTACKIPYYTV